MSYGAFTKAVSDEIGAIQSRAGARGRAPATTDYSIAERRVLDRWLTQGRHEALVRYAVANYDGSQGGEEFLRLLGENLVRAGRPDLVRKLYRPIIDRRRKHYFWRKARLQPRWPIPDFVVTLLNRVSRSRRSLGGYKRAVLAVMRDFRSVTAMTKEPDLADIDRQIAAFIDEAAPARPAAAALASRRMDEQAFWGLIAAARAIAETDGEIVATIEASLATLDPAAIERFQEILCKYLDRSYRWDLWAVAYAARGGCGDDAFDYFRQGLILQGKDVYTAAIADPVAWALAGELDFPLCEELLGAAPNAFRAKAGREMPPGKRKRATKPAGDAWKDAELAIRFPALAKRFELK